MRSPPPPPNSNILRGLHVCSHFLGEGGYLCGVCLRRFPKKAREMHIFCKKSNGYQLPTSRGYILHKIGGSGDEEWAKVPLILWKGGGGAMRSDRNLDHNFDSFDKHVPPLIAFSHWFLCFGAILQFLIFDLVIA